MGRLLEGMSNRCYHRARAISRSHLHALRTVPAGVNKEWGASTSMNIGTAAHTLVLEPHLFDESVVESKNKTSNSKDFQELVARFPEKCILPAGGIETVKALAENIWLHPKAKELLTGGFIPEPSLFWKDGDTGIWCKTRPDMMDTKKQIVCDLKFLAKGKADARKFTWAAKDFGYDLQAAWNIYGIKQVTGHLYTEFWFIVVETDAPYRVSCYQLDEEWLGEALWECKSLLQLEHECRQAGEWPNFVEANREGEIIYRGI